MAGWSQLWSVVNSPFTIFVLGSIVVAGLAKYWDYRQAQRYAAREQYRYIVETIHRVDYVLKHLPDSDLISLHDWWNANNALAGNPENTFYAPLFKDFREQPIEALVTLLTLGSREHRVLFSSLLQTLSELPDVTEGLQVIEKKKEIEKEEHEDLSGLAQLWTFWSLPPDRRKRLESILAALSADLKSLELARSDLVRHL